MWCAYPTCHTAQPKHTTETATNSGACARTRLISRSRSRRRMQKAKSEEGVKTGEGRGGGEGVGGVGEGVEDIRERVAVKVGTASLKWFFCLKDLLGLLGKGVEGDLLGALAYGGAVVVFVKLCIKFWGAAAGGGN